VSHCCCKPERGAAGCTVAEASEKLKPASCTLPRKRLQQLSPAALPAGVGALM